MQPDNNHMDDLEYLSKQGFERFEITEAELGDLTKKIRRKSFSYNSGFYFSGISLIIGVFIGVSVFFAAYQPPLERLSPETTPVWNDSTHKVKKADQIVLDTVELINENFVRKSFRVKQEASIAIPGDNSLIDSVVSIPQKDIDVSAALGGSVKENKIKFIINAPVFYLHDLKVSDYSSLYFKKNQFVRFNNTPVQYASKGDATQNISPLKENADYFLHEEIAGALLFFKNEKYDACINVLNNVATYNNMDINCNFYRGMCYFYKKNFNKSIGYLDLCVINQNNTFLQEAMYYKAIALFETGEKKKAMALFMQISEEDEFYAEKARQFLKSHRE